MKKLIVITGVLIAAVAFSLVGLRLYTKSFSPEDVSQFDNEETAINVRYSRPYKRGRQIFDGLIPYDKPWRTGANEATVFTTNKDLKIGNQLLKAGAYSIFTVPGKEVWTVIFNKKTGQWGINIFSGEANRDPGQDVLVMEVVPIHTPDIYEQFTISFEQMGEEIEMILMWDQTLIVVPMHALPTS